MNKITHRFYIVSELFNDDARLMYMALNEHLGIKSSKCNIYFDLLNCRYGKWIELLETVSKMVSKEWIEEKRLFLETCDDIYLKNGDMDMIEYICMNRVR